MGIRDASYTPAVSTNRGNFAKSSFVAANNMQFLFGNSFSWSVNDCNSLSQSCPVLPQYLSKHVPLKTHMASDYRPLSAEREIERSYPSELDFMYDKATLDQAAIFIEDAIKVSESYSTCSL